MLVKDVIEKYAAIWAQAIEARQTNRYDQITKHYIGELKQLDAPEDEIAAQLSLIAQNPLMEKAGYWILAAEIHLSLSYLQSLCQILEHPNAGAFHERVVESLQDLKDPRAIPSLVKALGYDQDFDPTKELAKRVLQTLDKIDTPEAKQIIQDCMNSPIDEIRWKAIWIVSGVDPGD
jgi:hypothetical protein